MPTSQQLLAEVAALLDAKEWAVAVEEGLEGIQLDITAIGPEGQEVAIECKAYTQLVGLRSVREFASSIDFLRATKPRLQGWLVTTRGFTPNAQRAMERYNLLGKTIRELRLEFGTHDSNAPERVSKFLYQAQVQRRTKKRVFVIMPFSEAMLDVFVLGIRWAAESLGAIAERADDLEHNGEIIAEVRRAISEYDAVVGDTTGANPNVCYEVGYAHAIGRPTILICRRGEKLPFDLRGTNHIMYPNILSLRGPLKKKLEAAFSGAVSSP